MYRLISSREFFLRRHRHRVGVIVKLKWLRRITSVNLSKNKIDDECESGLRDLMTIKHLRQLDLSGNEIGASAGVSMLESLVRCRELQVPHETCLTPLSVYTSASIVGIFTRRVCNLLSPGNV